MLVRILLVFISLLIFKRFDTAIGQTIAAKYTVYYEFSFVRDTFDKTAIISEPYILFHSNFNSYFYNQNMYFNDSLIYNFEQKHGPVTPENLGMFQKVVMTTTARTISDLRVLKDFNRKVTKVILPIAGHYKYMEQPLDPEWIFLEGIDSIQGHIAHKAKTTYGGRNYTAWYTEQIPINDGPYTFSGLPGLILKVEDDDHLYSFEVYKLILNSEQRVLSQDFFNRNVQRELSRDEYIKEIHNMKENPKFAPGVMGITAEDLAKMKNAYKKRFDLLLEWK